MLLNSLDGADTANGLPGRQPRRQREHEHSAGRHPADDADVPVPSAGATTPGAVSQPRPTFDPSIIFHEYTHGLSNRLVVDAAGNSTLNSVQAGSMGEAWSDYYAMDYLVTKGSREGHRRSRARVLEGKYVSGRQSTPVLRTMPIDCPVGATSPNVHRTVRRLRRLHVRRLPDIIGGAPEVHASGEIWAQTLWDLREQLGHTVPASIVTRAMELSPDDPTFLDMRNAILQADLAVVRRQRTAGHLAVFANRGMGFFAGVARRRRRASRPRTSRCRRRRCHPAPR